MEQIAKQKGSVMIMAEYIDREALLRFPIRIDNYDKENGNENFVFGIEAVLEYAEHIPTADVVEVVRCKECKYLMFSDFYGECSKGYMGIVYPNGFCSHGERADMRGDKR